MTPSDVCRDAIEQTHALYCANYEALGSRGYHVMYGPPKPNAPILFIGYQPGGDHLTNDHLLNEPAVFWPEISYYATEPWRLAVNLRNMFGNEILRESTGLNAIFFRSPNMKTYNAEVPLLVRRELATFSVTQVRRIVDALTPKLVVGIGFDSLRLFGSTSPVLISPKGRVLAESGLVGSRPAIGVLHLSGAQISNIDRLEIARFVRAGLI